MSCPRECLLPPPGLEVVRSHSFSRNSNKALDPGTGSRVHNVPVTIPALQSGELARLAGVSPDTIRHYERLGILTANGRSNGGYRMFSPCAVKRVRLARRALQLGFSLNEISGVLHVRDNGGIPCRQVLNLAEQKLQSLNKQIQELRRTQNTMRKLIRDWKKQLQRTPPGHKAMLLHSLAEKQGPASFPGNNLRGR